tara:strand:- start:615 stop:1754 length:1140 start_codon:yes stop_codon:yes gene_type:complete
MATNIPVLPDPNYYGNNPSSIEGNEVAYRRWANTNFEQLEVNFSADSKDRRGTVLRMETDQERGLLESILPWGGKADQKAYRIRVHGDDDHIPWPCDITSEDPTARGLIEQHKLFFCPSDITLKVGDEVEVNYMLGPGGARQSIGTIQRKISGDSPPPTNQNACLSLEQMFENSDRTGNSRRLGRYSNVGPSNSYPVVKDISELVPSIQPIIRRIVERMNAEGFDAVVHESLRSEQRAQALENEGYGSATSMHIYRVAVDIISQSKQWFQNEPNPDAAGAPFWNKLGEIAEDEGFVWGGRWTNGNFAPHGDRPHIQAVAVNEQRRARAMSDDERNEFAYQSIQRRRGSSSSSMRTPPPIRNTAGQSVPIPTSGMGTGTE